MKNIKLLFTILAASILSTNMQSSEPKSIFSQEMMRELEAKVNANIKLKNTRCYESKVKEKTTSCSLSDELTKTLYSSLLAQAIKENNLPACQLLCDLGADPKNYYDYFTPTTKDKIKKLISDQYDKISHFDRAWDN